ncbi:MAG: hypothetical protein ACSHYF_14735 [Verrucomicrobiaceae bacterium]
MLLFCGAVSVVPAFGHETEGQLRFAHPHVREVVETQVRLGWESRYLSEGRDSLGGDSLFTSSIELGSEYVAGGIWYGFSPDQGYDELQLSLTLARSIGDVDFYGGYTHLRFPFDGTFDNEIGAGVSWSGLHLEVELAADFYYSFDADGYFAELTASREFSLSDRLAINVSIPIGMNQNYVSDGHDGFNNLAVRLGAEYALTDSVSLTVHGVYNWALGREATLAGDDLLIDFFHGGVGMRWAF